MSEPWALILAAGGGRRMGGTAKALLPIFETTFLEHIVATARAAGVAKVAVVLGHHEQKVRPLAEAEADVVVTNPDPDQGMGSSVKAGAEAIGVDAPVLIWPVDTPKVRISTVEALLARGAELPQATVIPNFAGKQQGHPVLLPATLMPTVRAMSSEDRLDVLIDHEAEVVEVEVDDLGVTVDIDTRDDYVEYIF